MENYVSENVLNAPRIFFDFRKNELLIHGESYPENAKEFFQPAIEWIKNYLDVVDPDVRITVNIDLVYYNSSSAKILMNIFDMLESAAQKGQNIIVNWIYDLRNVSALESGEDFQEEMDAVTFLLVPKEE